MKYIIASMLGFIFLWPITSGAAIYNFDCGTNNSATDCATSEAYLSLEVLGTTKGASFTIKNVGANTSHTKYIWFDDDGGLLNISNYSKSESAGVNYGSLDTSTTNVGGLPDFVAEAESQNSPGAIDGVTSGSTAAVNPEYLTFDIALNTTFAILLAALNDGGLRVGIHVGSYAGGGSEKLSNISPVPVPAAMWLFGTALIGFVGMSRRTKV
jgi:hypothetical protein